MAYVTEQRVAEMEARYGTPEVLRIEPAITPDEMRMVRASQKGGRAHDVTLFLFGGDGRLALIRKPSFPPGGYRAPSGGINPGEEFEAGARREAYEETGLRVALERYVLRVHVRFTSDGDALAWTTHVFWARVVGGTLGTLDPHEIAQVCWATPDELQGPIREVLLATGRPLLGYRVWLTDEVVARLSAETGLPAAVRHGPDAP